MGDRHNDEDRDDDDRDDDDSDDDRDDVIGMRIGMMMIGMMMIGMMMMMMIRSDGMCYDQLGRCEGEITLEAGDRARQGNQTSQ